MDAFFAAVEQHDRPELRGLPVIVGSPPDARGVVSTCSYEARRFGVRSAMPSRTAAKLCPQGVFLPVRGARYREVSEQIFEVFRRFTPEVEPLSVDEAFLDLTHALRRFAGDGAAAARALKDAVREATGLTVSVGVAHNKFLAKLASDMDKPDGLTVVPRLPAEVLAFLAPLPVRRIWGVGEKSAGRLQARGIHTIGDLQQASRDRLLQQFGDHLADRLWRLCRGQDGRPVESAAAEKSISHEHTFDTDCLEWELVEQTLIRLIAKVGLRLRRQGSAPDTAFVKIRWSDFETRTHQCKLDRPATGERALLEIGLRLLRHLRQSRPVRLVGFGVRLTGAETAPPHHPDLFAGVAPPDDSRDRQLDDSVDAIRSRFGSDAIRRGTW